MDDEVRPAKAGKDSGRKALGEVRDMRVRQDDDPHGSFRVVGPTMMGTPMPRVVRSVVFAALAVAVSMPGASAGARAAQPWPLGTFTLLSGGVTDCPPGSLCQRFGISNCPNVSENAGGELAVSSPSGIPRGTVMFFSGGTATFWWSDTSPLSQRFVARLRSTDGFQVVQVRWVQPWLFAAPGEDAGPGHLACRPATLI